MSFQDSRFIAIASRVFKCGAAPCGSLPGGPHDSKGVPGRGHSRAERRTEMGRAARRAAFNDSPDLISG